MLFLGRAAHPRNNIDEGNVLVTLDPEHTIDLGCDIVCREMPAPNFRLGLQTTAASRRGDHRSTHARRAIR
eukprot:8573168-Lingulodinium_polyedra.AAC.1